MRDCKDKSTKKYARRQLQNGIPAAHVPHERALRIENLRDGTDEDEGGNHEMAHENE